MKFNAITVTLMVDLVLSVSKQMYIQHSDTHRHTMYTCLPARICVKVCLIEKERGKEIWSPK